MGWQSLRTYVRDERASAMEDRPIVPSWLRSALRLAMVLVSFAAAILLGLLAVGALMNAVSPDRDAPLPLVAVIILLLATSGLVAARIARRR